MNPGNNHTPTAYNETNEIKKSLETLTKIQQEHDIRNTDIELAKQAKKISEQMKSFGETVSPVKELCGIADGLADCGSPWFIVGKNGKA